MKHFYLFAFLFVWACLACALPICAQTKQELWGKVSEAKEKGLPQTAIEHLNKIYELSQKDNDIINAVKSLCEKIAEEGKIQGNLPEERIKRLETEIKTAPNAIKPMLKIVLAKWYVSFYNRNRYRFINRSTSEGFDNSDFMTWSLNKLFLHISSLFEEVLKNEESLKNIPVSTFKGFLISGTQPDILRPTLFDFFAHEALSFYVSDEQTAAKPENAFEITADSIAFEEYQTFIKQKPQTLDTDSCAYKALILFQRLIKAAIESGNKEALLDNDFWRIVWVGQTAVGEGATEKYLELLNKFIKANPHHKLASKAWAELAIKYYSENDRIKALNAAKQGMAKEFENTIGYVKCQTIKQMVLEKSLEIKTERVSLPTSGTIRVDYKNIDRVYFNLFERSKNDILNAKQQNADSVERGKYEEIIKQKPIKSWAASLKPTDDYKSRSQTLELPPLKKGFYYLAASLKNSFERGENSIYIAPVTVSNLTIAVSKSGGSKHEVFILNSDSGKPVEGAEVKLYEKEYGKKYIETASAVADKNGIAQFEPVNAPGMLFAEYNGDAVYLNEYLYPLYSQRLKPQDKAFIFTDRALYRPGQIIYYKVIAASVNPSKNDYAAFEEGENVVLRISDPNGQEIEKKTFQTNKFGSFSGSFTAPANCLNGEYTIEALNDSVQIRVEEYKRPKFEVTLNPPKTSYKLNDKITLYGTAKAYTGAFIDGAEVKYRVVRKVIMPFWYRWFFNAPEQEIAHGACTCNKQGEFQISFNAAPDKSISKNDEPTFTYSISADVTDKNGETRSDSINIRLGYTALALGIFAKPVIKANNETEIKITTSTLDNKSISGSGLIEIISLKQPQTPIKKDIFELRPSKTDMSNYQNWQDDKVVFEKKFNTSIDGSFTFKVKLPENAYRIRVSSRDRYNTPVKAYTEILAVNAQSEHFSIKMPFFVQDLGFGKAYQPGDTFKAFWATGYNDGLAYIKIIHRGKVVKQFWSQKGKNRADFSFEIEEKHRGGFLISVMQIKENRAYTAIKHINVPYGNKQLKLEFAHISSKLYPGQHDKWQIKISGEKTNTAAIEFAAAMYDKSLDAYLPFSWPNSFDCFYNDASSNEFAFSNKPWPLQCVINDIHRNRRYAANETYIHFSADIVDCLFAYQYRTRGLRMSKAYGKGSAPAPLCAAESVCMSAEMPDRTKSTALNEACTDAMCNNAGLQEENAQESGENTQTKQKNIAPRTNLNETAFFMPHLTCSEDGIVNIEFAVPEALTTWKFLGFAHSNTLQSGLISGETITQKDLMVQPNAPRFLREGDEIIFTSKITNLSNTRQKGQISLKIQDAATDKDLTKAFGLQNPTADFTVPANESRTTGWRLKVPDMPQIVKYTVIASSNSVSDGEEGLIPVLTRRIFVTESLPMPINGPAKKSFKFNKLIESAKSDTIKNEALTVEITSNPAWYAVLALPYLTQTTHECSEQVFNRLYANSLAKLIAQSDPKIKRVFDTWRSNELQGGKTLYSSLEKNQDLKAAALRETPWVLDAKNETEQRHKIAELFNENKLKTELNTTLEKLKAMQLSNGAFSWFAGGRESEFITLYIMAGFGRLRHLGVNTDMSLALKAVDYLDKFINELYHKIISQADYREGIHINSIIAMYLYGRSFFLNEKPISVMNKKAVDFFINEAKKHWLDVNYRLAQGHIALALQRFNETETAKDIVKSIKERSVYNEEMGRFWRENEFSIWWYRAEIETQAVMIEMFSEITNDKKAVEECKVWLLKQKQTQNWKTTKATADAIYALLLEGCDLLSSNELVRVELNGKEVEKENVEAGTGYYLKKYSKGEISADMGNATLQKNDKGTAWGALYWQYFEDISKITPHETNLKLKKSLFVKKDTEKGPVITPIRGKVRVGDLIVARIELKTDRDMEFVFMKDSRASGMEPTNILSAYKYQDGLAYYESAKDTASHFYFDYLPKGTYVFEYEMRVQHAGVYQSGMAEIQCMYAPEFSSHSESVLITAN